MYILNIVKYLPKCVIYNAILCFVHLRNRCDSEELDNHWKIEMCDQPASSEAVALREPVAIKSMVFK